MSDRPNPLAAALRAVGISPYVRGSDAEVRFEDGFTAALADRGYKLCPTPAPPRVVPLTASELAVFREGLRDLPPLIDDDPLTLTEATRREWMHRCARLLATLDARDDALRAALKGRVRALGYLTPEDWNERRGGDPIARTVNAVTDIIDEVIR